MTARSKLDAAIVALHAEQAVQLAEWRNLWLALGRAMAALDSGDRETALAELNDAEGLEYSLLGSCDNIGRVVGLLDPGEDRR